MVTVGKLQNDGRLLLKGEINERLPSVLNGLVAHYPFDGTDTRYVPNRIRYIRDWVNSSTANAGDHWVEIKATDYNGTNVALNKPVTTNSTQQNATIRARITNGNIDSGEYAGLDSNFPVHVIVDLEGLFEIDKITVWHYYADSRTYYDTKTEVSQDGITWFSIFDSAIEGTYKETASGKIHTLSNLGATVTPSLNTNTTLLPNGIAVEDAATNVWSGGFSIYNNYGQPASITKLDETYLGEPIYRVKFTVTDPTRLSHFQNSLSGHGVYGGSQPWVENTKYAVSVYWRPVNKLDLVVGGTASNTGGWFSGETEYLEDGWRRFYRYRSGVGVATKNDSIHHSFICPSLKLNEDVYFDICCPQTEEGRMFPTSYINGSTSAGKLSVPTNRLETYTVFGCFVPASPFKNGSTTYDITANSADLIRIDDTVKVGGFYYRFWLSGSSSCPYIDPDGYYGTPHIHQYYQIDNLKPMYFAIRKSGTSLKMKIYQDGWRAEHILTVPVDAGMDLIKFGDATRWNGRYKNVSIYNRELSDDELNKLISKKFSLTKGGDIITPKLTEKLNKIPSDAVHLPLDSEGSDRLKYIVPSLERGTLYEDGAVWIGSRTENLMYGKEPGIYKLDSGTDDKGFYVIRSATDETSYHGIHAPNIPIPQGSIYTFSLEFMTDIAFTWSVDHNDYADNYAGNDAPREWGTIEGHKYTTPGKWQRVYMTVKMRDDALNPKGGAKLTLSHTSAAAGHKVYIRNVQFELQSFPTPYVENVRENSAITYNVPIMDVVQPNWAIFGFYNKYDYLDGAYFLQKIGTESFNIGSYGSAPFSPYWGRPGNGAACSTNPNHEKKTRTWKFFAIVRDGNSVHVYDGMGGILYKGTDNRGVYFNDHTTTGWTIDSGSKFNGYLKDLCFVPRSLTDAELKAIYNTNMMNMKDGIHIQNSLKEGYIV